MKNEKLENFRVRTKNDEQIFGVIGSEVRTVILF